MENKASYRYTIEKNFICIIDNNADNMTVTNCAESVLKEIAEKEKINPSKFNIIYRDTDGIWDQIIFYEDRVNVTFKHLGAKTKEAAKTYFVRKF